MQTCFSSDNPEYLPIPCTIIVHQQDQLGADTIWGFYPPRCHVESELPLSHGMNHSLSLHLPGNARAKLEGGFVTWSKASEFGLEFAHASTTRSERSTP
jgi:hypothetical protein